MVTCPSCHKPNKDSARFCLHCGQAIGQAAVTSPRAPGSNGPTVSAAVPPRAPITSPIADVAVGAAGIVTRVLVPPPFAPLNEGELLAERRYCILSAGWTEGGVNVYLAESGQDDRVCPTCGQVINLVEDRFCPNCRTELGTVQTLAARYVIKESADPYLFDREKTIARLHLTHPHIVRIYEGFDSIWPSGVQRHYLVYDQNEQRGQLLSELVAPQATSRVLRWGTQLSQALAYLHGYNLFHRKIDSGTIRVEEERAWLTGFQLADHHAKPPPPEEAQRWRAEDVRALARVLAFYITGRTPYAPDSTWPTELVSLFERAFGPTRASLTAQEFAQALEAAHVAMTRPVRLAWRAAHLSDVGRVRSLNEDSLLALDSVHAYEASEAQVGLYIIADGMGGQAAGEIASRTAVATIGHHVLQHTLLPTLTGQVGTVDYKPTLQAALEQANKAVFDLSRAQRNNMGTTALVVLLVGGQAYVGNVGDSRAYWLDGASIRQITVDHSLVERLIATGRIRREDARTHPERNLIYRHLGEKARVEVDTFEQALRPGQWLVLCSDGLNSMIEDDTILEAVAGAADPQAACQELVRRALEAGGEDNVSVIAIQIR